MRQFAPKYYENFRCIADKCTHSCCKGWEIDIDPLTLARYEGASGGYIDKIKASISYEGTPHFALQSDRCPHLDGRGLCKIITEMSEGWLCEICREHPRFYNRTVRGLEVGVGMSCEEAARVILREDGYAIYSELESVEGVCEAEFSFDAVSERERIYAKLSDRGIPYLKRLDTLYTIYAIDPKMISDEQWRETLASLEYFDTCSGGRFSFYSSSARVSAEYEIILERFLAYLIYRHTASAKSEADFLSSLGFCFFVERLFASVLSVEEPSDIDGAIDIARTVSEEIEYSEDNTDTLKMEFEFI